MRRSAVFFALAQRFFGNDRIDFIPQNRPIPSTNALTTKTPPSLVRLPVYGLLLLGAFLNGCTPNEPAPDISREGYRPVYISREALETVTSLPPQPLRKPGKLFIRDQILFINEVGKGIHVLDNRDPRQPRKLGFLSIPDNIDLAVKGDFLYADNATDLVVFNIQQPTDVRVVRRVANVFPAETFPPEIDVSFECVDPAKGIVVGWERVLLTNPKCRR
ncbi:MAG: hypothetical protein LH606_11870 [Cytophagaceae bacterium]|nr:hypothetical protein [Cytophagaceae bacterium]